MEDDIRLTFEERAMLVKLVKQINGWGVDRF